eukprot:CAMPEP_0180325804 /NCGR_PEP_ID=MMETSP0988-20121125/38633_1 /TAXON_ID=697907 /ORGANISM="non described non described, Strain CCMP2293" /LENGTH=188 /DNA_ID=CAMNT_0022312285 /DNA_START=13 /DNA_END=580 /DNA_ORIENTATION=-
MAAVPTAAFCSPPTAANSMGLSAKLTQLQEAEAAGLLTAKELATARQRAIDGFVGHAEAGAPERGAAAAGAWGPTGAWAPAGGVAQPPLGVAPPATALPYQGLITTKDIEGCWICCCFPFCWWALFKKVATGPDTLNHVGASSRRSSALSTSRAHASRERTASQKTGSQGTSTNTSLTIACATAHPAP